MKNFIGGLFLGSIFALIPVVVWWVIITVIAFVIMKSGGDATWINGIKTIVVWCIYIFFTTIFTLQFTFFGKTFNAVKNGRK